MNETEFLAAIRCLATDPAARGFADDAAVLGDLVLTHDMIVEGVHFLPDDPPEDVAWKLAAVNLSDLAAKGAEPVGCLLGYTLGAAAWNARFVAGLREVLARHAMPLLGGDTVRANGPRSFGLTAIGRAARAPSRDGARAGDALYVTGTIGRAGIGLQLLKDGNAGPEIDAYRRPQPRLAEGRALAPLVHAMMDVSDGLLIDAKRMADASGLAVSIDLAAVPVSGDPLDAVVAGDDYELLFAVPTDATLPVPSTRIGHFEEGLGLSLTKAGIAVPLPPSLGWLHG
ncbi:thiamine-phosphate kinase [Sphingomonas sp. MAH-20]|uniref:Thiamine-monophosphate kinase n=1 Tax=Sphingomonas horti TaxID=2682842 RepID=A0A6I4IZT6_9SPHN|nr:MULTISPECIES: thiamine-phosphate kinase [Sphingomonas]MBA2920751.1 thiamine-phosphate kinase [Sphingomonas sp. CGMCC 1.13658]MVO77687.1 thiamine-phosphate kinase [Sphingomonas horti]